MAERARSKISMTPMSILIAVLVGVVIFVLVSLLRQEQEADLEGLSESDLVRLIDEVDTRISDLTVERESLQRELEELKSGADTQAAAAEAASQQERIREVQAGVVPVVGPGVSILVMDSAQQLPAQSLVTLIQELRNAAAEAIEINGIRVVTRTAIVSQDGEIYADGTRISSPYVIRAIGDSDMLRVALEMPGGILAAIRSRGATADLTQSDQIHVQSVAELPTFTFAEPIN